MWDWLRGNQIGPDSPKHWLVDGNRGIVESHLISLYEAHVAQHFRNIAFHLSEPAVYLKPVSLTVLQHGEQEMTRLGAKGRNDALDDGGDGDGNWRNVNVRILTFAEPPGRRAAGYYA